MTPTERTPDQHWASIEYILDEGWPNAFTPESADAYRTVLTRFPAHLVAHAVGELAAAGSKFRPTIGEIAAECHRIRGTQAAADQFDAPTWDEIYPGVENLAFRYQDKPGGPEAVEGKYGPVVAGWFARGGSVRLLTGRCGDPTYGSRNQATIAGGYRAFVENQRTRAARGLTVATRHDRGGLRPVDQLRALDA